MVASMRYFGHNRGIMDGMELFKNTLMDATARWGISISPPQLELMCVHYQAMIEVNQLMNLTRITEPVDAAIKHYADSLSILHWVNQQQIQIDTVLDIGTGAGFPAYPLAVMKPEWNITAIDGTEKKIHFIRGLKESASLDNLELIHAHTDHWGDERRFTLVITRAVAPLVKCFFLAAERVAHHGYFVTYKTATPNPREQTDADEVLSRMSLQAIGHHDYEMDCSGEVLKRKLYIYRRRSV